MLELQTWGNWHRRTDLKPCSGKPLSRATVCYPLSSAFSLPSTNHSIHTAWVEDRRRVNGASLTRIKRNGKKGLLRPFRWEDKGCSLLLASKAAPLQTDMKESTQCICRFRNILERKKERNASHMWCGIPRARGKKENTEPPPTHSAIWHKRSACSVVDDH